MRIVLMLVVTGCSFVGIHYPAAPSAAGRVRCVTVLPVADTVVATVALGAGGYRYAVETRTSPFPLTMVLASAWASASAVYGYIEEVRCRSELVLAP